MVRSVFDAALIESYNGIGYDLPYMAIRARKLQCQRFFHMGVFLARIEDRIKADEENSHYHRARYKSCCVQINAPLGTIIRPSTTMTHIRIRNLIYASCVHI